ncbi:MAG: hypothetical protein A3H99_05060 [Gallionellales bacterium RIFCSPLOWO2_02_FULL_59_110]|nr:MAG: hypothetical protein A3H99_05060 [Gallionellales bacterium RIFCSPLOWO2_02_FULL_59_110]OGT04396.1 MAG: hypothetical protein A2Z65_06430 [Gallionellales bacterium RIFCSPLOWO2_02_58_13]
MAEGFDRDEVGAAPVGWSCGMTGQGAPLWSVEADMSAPSKPNVLLQSGSAAFPWCVKQGKALTDGFVETKLKPIVGNIDRAGGVVWRWKDAGSYYVARANELENNVTLYRMEQGVRKTLKRADAPVLQGQWNILRVEFSGQRIRVLLNGQAYIETDDAHITGSGSIGVWTKADSMTAFDDFVFGEIGAGQK